MLIAEIDLPIIVDAGIGAPSHACEAMELGADAVLANTAVATARDVAAMAEAFQRAIQARPPGLPGRAGTSMDFHGEASSPLTSFWRTKMERIYKRIWNIWSRSTMK